jgi:DNA-binding NarL/FixJ family response regulator
MKSRKTDASVPSPAKAKIVLVEDQPDVSENWSRLINSFPDFTCIRTCISGEEAMREIPALQPDVILMDIFLPRMSGIECTARLKAILPNTQIIILTAMNDRELIFLALEAGADGYLLKRTKPADLRQALMDALEGGAPMTSQIARRVIETFRRKVKTQEKAVGLSAREEEILVLLTKGLSNKLIADQIGLSYDTVSSHLKRVYQKLHVNSRTEAVLRYLARDGKSPGERT